MLGEGRRTRASKIVPFRGDRKDIALYDPDTLRLRDDEIPAAKVETATSRKRRRARKGLHIPATAWPAFAAVVASGVSGRSVGLWVAIRMQAKIEGQPWVRIRTHLRESLGFTNRAAHSRAVTELEQAGLIEVERRPGYTPLVRLVPGRAGDEDEDNVDG
jgi:hypothetical protein